jgi:hypothetical protein
MMFRLQSNWPARHDRRNGDAVILPHQALDDSREHFLLDRERRGHHGVPHTGATRLDACQAPPRRCPVLPLRRKLRDPRPAPLPGRGQALPPLGQCRQRNARGLRGIASAGLLPLPGGPLALQPGTCGRGPALDRRGPTSLRRLVPSHVWVCPQRLPGGPHGLRDGRRPQAAPRTRAGHRARRA